MARYLTAAIVATFASMAQAQESAPVTTPHATVTLASETSAVEPGKPFRLGLHFKLAKGWHIYWSNPGAAGEPPKLDLTLPTGAKASDLAFPTPERVRQSDEVMSYAYLGEVLLPFTVTPPAGLTAFQVKAKASWLICEKICVPEQGELSARPPDRPSLAVARGAAVRRRRCADSKTLGRRGHTVRGRRSHAFRVRPLA